MYEICVTPQWVGRLVPPLSRPSTFPLIDEIFGTPFCYNDVEVSLELTSGPFPPELCSHYNRLRYS